MVREEEFAFICMTIISPLTGQMEQTGQNREEDFLFSKRTYWRKHCIFTWIMVGIAKDVVARLGVRAPFFENVKWIVLYHV